MCIIMNDAKIIRFERTTDYETIWRLVDLYSGLMKWETNPTRARNAYIRSCHDKMTMPWNINHSYQN